MIEAVKLTRAQRREMKKFADKIDRITQADRLFFERRPDRKHRVRLSGKAEIGHNEIAEGKLDLPPGWRWYTAVRNVAPGVRLRQFLIAPEDRETDLPEETARAVFEKIATPQTWEFEAELRRRAAELRP